MVQRGQRLCFTREPLGKLGILHPFWREEFQCHETVQGFLPRLIDHAHAAATEKFKDFELRKIRGDLFGRQWWLHGRRVVRENGFRLQVQRHETMGTKPCGCILLEKRTALRTF